MPGTSPTTMVPVPLEEVQRRLEEYRRFGFAHRAMPHGVYPEPFVLCPWPGCAYSIRAVDFQIAKMNDPHLYSQALAAWWQGPGIVARCPGCQKPVLFSMTEKRSIDDPLAANLTVLPDDWHQTAYIVS